MSLASLVARGRAAAEALMVDACTVTRTSAGTFDDTTGTYGSPTVTTVYTGPCRVRMPAATGSPATAGEAAWTLNGAVISLPVSTSEDVRDGDTVTLTSAAFDDALVGLAASVKGLHWQTHSTARRLSCEVVTRDA